MTFVIVIAGVVVVAVFVLVAMGWGGELSAERSDYVPLDLGPVSATDVVLLRPPTGLWGYNMQATDEAMGRIAASIKERDVRIVALEQLVTDLSREPAPPPLASPYAAARHRRTISEPNGMAQPPWPAAPVPPSTAEPASSASAGSAGSAGSGAAEPAWPESAEPARPESAESARPGPGGNGPALPPEKSHD